MAGTSAVFAEGNVEGATLDVYVDDTLYKSYGMDDLEAIWNSEGSKKYTYSAYNTYPSAKLINNAEGPSIAAILKDALGDEVFNNISDDQMVEFVARDGVKEGFLKKQLFEKRYYYPDFDQDIYIEGKAARVEDKEQKEPVPAIISLYEDGKSYESNSSVGRLLIGQVSPHEQNFGAFVNKLTPVVKNRKASIIIHSNSQEPWNAIQSLTGTAENTAAYGTMLGFNRDVNTNNHGSAAGRYWIYYTTDGSEPTYDSAIYNYNNFSFGEPGEKFNRPVFTVYGPAVIKTFVGGYGRQDSGISTFNINVVPASPRVTASAVDYKSVRVTWTGVSGAKEYRVYRSTNRSSGFRHIKTVTGTTCTDAPLQMGVTYYYKITAYANASDGSTVTGRESAVAAVAPALNAPTIKSLSAKKKTITVKWYRVAGASGYKIYRATKWNGKYKLVKTIKKGSTISFKNKKLKKKKTYYYKIRAYRTFAGRTVYSGYSAVKYKKVK